MSKYSPSDLLETLKHVIFGHKISIHREKYQNFHREKYQNSLVLNFEHFPVSVHRDLLLKELPPALLTDWSYTATIKERETTRKKLERLNLLLFFKQITNRQAIHFPFWFIKIANRDVIIDHIIIFERGNAHDTYNSLQVIAMSKRDRNSEIYVYYPTDDI